MRLIVLEPRGIGNVITSLPLLQRAVQGLGAERVAVLCRPAYASVLESVESLDVRLVRSELDVLRSLLVLRGQGFRHFLAAPPISPSKALAVCAATGIECVRPRPAPRYHGRIPIGTVYQDLANLLSLGRLGPPRLPYGWPRVPLASPLAADLEVWLRARRRLAVHLGCEPNLVHKRWAIEHFTTCVREVSRAIPDLRVALVGTEIPLARGFQARASGQIDLLDLSGRTSLEDAARFIRVADAMLSCDSGLMHLAAALGVPAFAVFGPTSPAFLFPQDNPGRWFQSLSCAGPCYPRITRACRAARCVDRVSPHVVARAILAALENSRVIGAGAEPEKERMVGVAASRE